MAVEKGLTNSMAGTSACGYSRFLYQEMLCQEGSALRSRRTLWKYKKSFNLLHTLQNFVISAFTSFYEDRKSVLTAVEKRREGCFQDTMPGAIDLGLRVEKAFGASILSVGCNSLLLSLL